MKQMMWIFALVPLLGIALFCLLTPRAADNPRPKAQLGIQNKSGVQPQHDSRDTEVRRNRDELVNESMASTAKLMTPQRLRQWTDTLMKVRQPRYHALFESWNLESAKADEVLEIVRERETAKYEALKVLNQEGTKGRPVFGETLSFGRESSDFHLGLILGEDRFEEFSRLEAQMESEMQAQAYKLLPKD